MNRQECCDKLRAAVERDYVTYTEAARDVPCSYVHLSKIMSGLQKPSITMARLLEARFGVDLTAITSSRTRRRTASEVNP